MAISRLQQEIGRKFYFVNFDNFSIKSKTLFIMEQHALKNVNNRLNANFYSYLETAGGQSSNP